MATFKNAAMARIKREVFVQRQLQPLSAKITEIMQNPNLSEAGKQAPALPLRLDLQDAFDTVDRFMTGNDQEARQGLLLVLPTVLIRKAALANPATASARRSLLADASSGE